MKKFFTKNIILKVMFIICLLVLIILLVKPIKFNGVTYTASLCKESLPLKENDVIVQNFKTNVDYIYNLGVQVANYKQDNTDGSIRLTLKDGDSIISTQVVELNNIVDGQMIYFDTSSRPLAINHTYTFEAEFEKYTKNASIGLWISNKNSDGYSLNNELQDNAISILEKGKIANRGLVWYPLMACALLGSVLAVDIDNGGKKNDKKTNKK